jgi:hypothetical protein
MKALRLAPLLLAASALVAAPRTTRAANVDISLNVYPTNVALPNNGGNWQFVAKTDAPLGIAGISAYLLNINAAGVTYRPGINAQLFSGQPFVLTFGSVINLGYFQDILSPGIVVGVGTPLVGDGPDPLGNPAWNNATKILLGTYSGVVPSFTISGSNTTAANVLGSSNPGVAAIAATVTTVVRVAVPEPASVVAGLMAVLGIVAARRRR